MLLIWNLDPQVTEEMLKGLCQNLTGFQDVMLKADKSYARVWFSTHEQGVRFLMTSGHSWSPPRLEAMFSARLGVAV